MHILFIVYQSKQMFHYSFWKTFITFNFSYNFYYSPTVHKLNLYEQHYTTTASVGSKTNNLARPFKMFIDAILPTYGR